MRQRIIVVAAAALLAFAHRLPAPIVEESPTPEQLAKPKPKPAKSKAAEALSEAESSSARRFDGTWQVTKSAKDRLGNSAESVETMIIINGKKAQRTSERTITLAPGQSWTSDILPKPYNAVSPVFVKYTEESTDLRIEGSNLVIHWPGSRPADWAPKTIPAGLFKLGSAGTTTYILEGNQLISTGEKSTAVWQRVR